MKYISTENAPAAIGPYSQAIEANGFLFASGQVPLSPVTGEVVGTTIEEQAKQSCENVKGILTAAQQGGSTVRDGGVIVDQNMDMLRTSRYHLPPILTTTSSISSFSLSPSYRS